MVSFIVVARHSEFSPGDFTATTTAATELIMNQDVSNAMPPPPPMSAADAAAARELRDARGGLDSPMVGSASSGISLGSQGSPSLVD